MMNLQLGIVTPQLGMAVELLSLVVRRLTQVPQLPPQGLVLASLVLLQEQELELEQELEVAVTVALALGRGSLVGGFRVRRWEVAVDQG